jgi:hypothetical protein
MLRPRDQMTGGEAVTGAATTLTYEERDIDQPKMDDHLPGHQEREDHTVPIQPRFWRAAIRASSARGRRRVRETVDPPPPPTMFCTARARAIEHVCS